MKKCIIVVLAFLLLAFGVSGASAVTLNLYESAFNVNGNIDNPGSGAPGLEDSAFDWNTGLGTLEITYSPAVTDDYYLLCYLDHEIDEEDNTYFNEYGVGGLAASGQSWEIDEPGFKFGDIYTNFSNGSLDKTNAVPLGSEDDVSMAMGWNFTLSDIEFAVIQFMVSEVAPASGFYLTQTDPNSNNNAGYSIYYSSTLTIEGGIPPIPEPATMILIGTGLIGLVGLKRKKFRKK